MSKATILLVEDEQKIARFLQLELEYEGYSVKQTQDGKAGLEMALGDNVDLVILDIMLPGLNGLEVCRRIRQSSQVPIIMLTAKDTTMDKVIGLDIGADDYITKPFAIEELLARVRVALKRKASYTPSTDALSSGNLKIDLSRHLVTYGDSIIELTKKEFDLLEYLVKNKGIVLTRESILEKVWGYDYMGDTNLVDVYIRYLRSKLDESYDKKFIHTVRGVGYLLKDE